MTSYLVDWTLGGGWRAADSPVESRHWLASLISDVPHHHAMSQDETGLQLDCSPRERERIFSEADGSHQHLVEHCQRLMTGASHVQPRAVPQHHS